MWSPRIHRRHPLSKSGGWGRRSLSSDLSKGLFRQGVGARILSGSMPFHKRPCTPGELQFITTSIDRAPEDAPAGLGHGLTGMSVSSYKSLREIADPNVQGCASQRGRWPHSLHQRYVLIMSGSADPVLGSAVLVRNDPRPHRRRSARRLPSRKLSGFKNICETPRHNLHETP